MGCFPYHRCPIPTIKIINIIISNPGCKCNYSKKQTTKDIAKYLLAACGSPSISTFLKAIKDGLLQSWQGINLIQESDLSPSIATAKGHLDQEQKNLQSTKSQSPPVPAAAPPAHHDTTQPTSNNIVTAPTESSVQPQSPETVILSQHSPINKSQKCYAVINQFDRKAFSDLTGCYPHISSRGNQCILVAYDYNNSGILVKPLKNRQAAEITRAWFAIYSRLKRNGNAPKLYILDNEVSYKFKAALCKRKVAFQLVPPHMHRCNAAERAICTFKNHFISVLATADPEFPVAEWGRLLPQAELTLNLIRPCRVNHKLSAYAYLFGLFDFNKTPLAPAGTKVLVHEKSQQHASWANHGIKGWYIGPSMDHYHCVKCYLPSTGGIGDTDTVQIFPKQVPFPKISTEDMLLQSAADILAVLQSPPPSLIPTIHYGDEAKNAIDHLACILRRAFHQTKPQPPDKPYPFAPPQHLIQPPSASPPRVSVPALVLRVPPAPSPSH